MQWIKQNQNERSSVMGESNSSVPRQWDIYQRSDGQYNNAEFPIKHIFLWFLNQLCIQKLFTECLLCARQHAGHLAHKGKIVNYEVGEIGREKFKKGLNFVKA